ncbi:MAG: tRNA (N(6)-L-threonylcarbamoyladenosine(37)-C(2))-methylthiotransferase MtaB [Deltaproteobacteria bacterium]|nr:tRNA (N(6)-L-threonylcarbamoyladenosine(37)-C(2))-methylthiotransferase MtaB [Deltaproteobacteria bacterium]
MRYLIKTLGCKVNQIESAQLAENLEREGYCPASEGEKADLCILNTCTVTARTDAECRRVIRRLVRENPGARIVVTGCYAETDPEAIKAVPGIDRVVGKGRNGGLSEILIDASLRAEREEKVSVPRPSALLERFGNRSRAFVKIQDGCEAFCSYCIVPYARGRYRSEDPEQVIRQVETFVQNGYPEIVLSGIHLGAYGVDRREPGGLSKLLARLIRIPGDFRIRLSSLEPMEVDDALIDLVTGEEKVCNHLHIPLQCGDDAILARMKRPYRTERYADLVLRLRERDPAMAIGTDLIAGFPGEDDASFERSFQFLETLPLTHFHVFPYSVRSGTVAADLNGGVPGDVKKERCQFLRELGCAKNRRFRERMVGRTLQAVATGTAISRKSAPVFLTNNYLKVLLPHPQKSLPLIFSVKVLQVSDDMLLVETAYHDEKP